MALIDYLNGVKFSIVLKMQNAHSIFDAIVDEELCKSSTFA